MAVDPWLPERLRADAELVAAEAAIEKAVRAAIDQWLTEVRRLVLGPDETLTAAGLALVEWARATGTGNRLEPRAILAAGDVPNLEGFGQADPVWLAALRNLIKPAILDLFTERFLAFARGAIIAAQPYRDAFINQVFSRLRLFPAQEFENIRFEIAEGISEGEGVDLIRDRVAAQLDFDTTRGAQGEQSASRGVQGRIDEVEKLLDADDAATDANDPDRLSAGERAALRKERGELYREKRRLDQKWEYKARRIARTEAIGALNGGDYSGALASEEIEGITLWKQWLATTDERTRHSHVLADGQVQKLRDPFIVGGWPLEHPGDPVGPGHEVINCFPGDVVVRAPSQIKGVYRRWYEGPMIRVKLAGGAELTGTPNHPVLTSAGWQALKDLDLGGYLVHARWGEGVGVGQPQIGDVPTELAEVYRAAAEAVVPHRIVGRGVDFHGDAVDGGEIEVVPVDLDLRPPVRERLGDGEFMPLLHGQSGLAHLGRSHHALGERDHGGGVEAAALAPCLVSAGGKGSPALESDALHTQAVGIRGVSDLDAGGYQARPDSRTGEPEFLGQGEFRFTSDIAPNDLGLVDILAAGTAGGTMRAVPSHFHTGLEQVSPHGADRHRESGGQVGKGFAGSIALGEIVAIEVNGSFSGHVYNLETVGGWYSANGIASHNCRCTALYHDADDLEAEGIDPNDLPSPEGDPLVSPEEMAANASRSAARIEAMADMNAAAVPVGGEMAEQLPNGWRGVLAPLDTKSGDGRIIATPSTLRVREAPRSLLWQPELSDYHGGAVVVGRIDRVWEENGFLMGEGPFDLGDEMAQKAARQLGEGFANGVSVDLDDFTMVEAWHYADGAPIPDDVLEVADWDELWEDGARPISMMTDWRLMAATLVSQPAFNEARLVPVYDYTPADDADLPPGVTAPAAEDGAELVAAVSGDTGLPVAPAGTPWDPEGATERIFARFTDPDTGEVDTAAVASAYLWVDEDTDPAMPEAYWIGFADWLEDADGNGALTTIPAGAQAAADYVVTGLDASTPEADVTALRAAVCSLYDSIRAVDAEWPECPTAEDAEDEPNNDGMGDAGMESSAAPRRRLDPRSRAGRAAVKGARRVANRTAGRRPIPARPGGMTIVAAAAPAYAAADFADPGLTSPTPLTVSNNGHVKGHLAIFGTCHTSFPDVCVTPPRTQTGYAMFHLGEVQTDAGPIGVGKITLGTGHATPRAGARPASEHYDHTGTCVAVVRAGEDEHGIWVAGRLVEDITPERLAALRRSPLSGDWRRVNGNLELVAALAVNTPGFPVPRTMVASAGGSQLSLVAAGVVPRPKSKAKRDRPLYLTPAEFARQVIAEERAYARRGREADRLAARLGLDHATQAEALAARIGVGV